MPSLLSVGLIQPFIELTLYGIYFVIFSTMVYLLCHRTGLTKRPMIFVFLALVFQFLLITAHWINTIYDTYLPFVQLGGGVAAEQFYNTLGTPSLKIHIFLSEIVNTITDCLVIHRLYVIREHRINIVILPICLLLVQITSATGVIVGFFTQSLDKYQAWSRPWVTTNLVASMAISAYSTGLISWKILRMNRMLQPFPTSLSRGRRLTSILAIMVESAALQTYAPLLFTSKSGGQHISSGMNLALFVAFQIPELAPNVVLKQTQAVVLGLSSVLIHTRIGLGWTRDNPSTTASNPTAVSFTVNVARSRDVEETELGPYPRK
ncbi:hypothetical protein DFH09DRAFT_1368122 [Mycena vulgaris]|nr:hypothetical protein DFH09DRAFT_1368122 [Mycena vulgaris]